MINLRYHIVSIVGIFLALGIGVALGSTFVDGFVVSTLERRVNDLEGDRDSLREQLSAVDEVLAAERAERAALEVAAIPLVGAGRLTDTPVMLIATDGIDDAAFRTIRAAVLGTDATYEGTLWLTDRLDLSDEANRSDLAELFSLAGNGETLVRRALESRLVSTLFPPAPEDAGSVLGGTASDIVDELLDSASADLSVDPPVLVVTATNVLSQLRDAAFVRYDNEFAVTGSLQEIPEHGTRFIFIANADAELDPAELIHPLLDSVVEAEIDVTLVAVEPAPSDDSSSPVAFVGPIRDDPGYGARVATVDDATDFAGILSLLAVTDTGEVLHLGTGRGATAPLPPA